MLFVASLVVIVAPLLCVLPNGRVALSVAPDHPLPESCLLWTMLGMHCPGCGLTRSFVYLAHGDLAASLAIHRVGWVMALAVLVQFPYRLAALAWPERELLSARVRFLFSATLIALLLGNWLYGLVQSHWP
jgi:Protein of unknown function (DUF2752)